MVLYLVLWRYSSVDALFNPLWMAGWAGLSQVQGQSGGTLCLRQASSLRDPHVVCLHAR